MTNRQDQKYLMYRILNQLLLRAAAAVPWKAHLGLAGIVAQWIDCLTNLRRLRQRQAQETTGLTLDKATLRRRMCDEAMLVADATRAFAVAQGDQVLAATVNVRCSQILYGKGDDAETVCRNICDAAVAAPLTAGLETFGVTAEKLVSLQEKIDDFADAMPQPRAAIQGKKSVTQQIAEEFRTADRLLTEGMDLLIGQFQKTHPDFVRDYQNARVLIDKAATLGDDEETRPDTGANPQPTVVPSPKVA